MRFDALTLTLLLPWTPLQHLPDEVVAEAALLGSVDEDEARVLRLGRRRDGRPGAPVS